MASPPGGPSPRAPTKTPRSNAGRPHRTDIRVAVRTAWEAQCDAQPGLKLMSPAGDAAIDLIVQCFVLSTKHGRTLARSWIEKAEAGADLTHNAAGAGGATAKLVITWVGRVSLVGPPARRT